MITRKAAPAPRNSGGRHRSRRQPFVRGGAGRLHRRRTSCTRWG
ncbi:hypothetical protein KCH_02680 [Kitasatospora cheerisanensis KCTC 2395]|uniref:Uncharacterized protein n=1 Tax=Kitasatospora cheerisanensis KCTC 2395 TaxID=1348663 RepID=A0A066ZCD1_9ACTN|nr:hypothetical protein KCH_02680 [Kitasatospora cheerisanensis KCTC 2395]